MKINENIKSLKKHWQIIYAAVLILLVPVAIILNTVWVTNSLKGDIDILLQRQALSIAEVFNGSLQDQLQNKNKLQAALNRVASMNEEIKFADILVREGENFRVIASLQENRLGALDKNVLNVLAWHENESIANITSAAVFLQNEPFAAEMVDNLQQRFWSVTSPLIDENGEKRAILNLKMSLSMVDELVSRTLMRSYIILAIAVLIVVLLLIANTRLFQYAVLAKKLKEVEQLKDEFISMASHELRTPITSIRGYLSMLSDGSLGKISKLAKEKVNMMSGSADRLSELVEDLLNVSRIEQGRLEIDYKIEDIAPIIDGVVNELRVQADTKGLKLVYEKFADLPKILVDSQRLKQVLFNIVGNAIKYTPNGSVTITCGYNKDENSVSIKCSDTGLGMSQKQREKLFTKFYRVKTKETESIKGTGLGLWITKQLVELMRGGIYVDSIENVGTEITIQFPVPTKKQVEAILIKWNKKEKPNNVD